MKVEAVIKVNGPEGSRKLLEASDEMPGKGDLSYFFRVRVFPLLQMDRWLSELVNMIPKGHVTTFGKLAHALGTIHASRAVGELISTGSVKGPVHRVVYSDGRVPERSSERLSSEVPTSSRELKGRMIGLELKHPPLASLRSMQKVLLERRETEQAPIRDIAGMDISSKHRVHAAAMVVMDRNGEQLHEMAHVGETNFPYVPGLLFFREAPVLMPLLDKARSSGMVDSGTLLVLDGNGILHPMRMGIAVQFGIVTETMTCGVAKRLMVGKVGAPRRLDQLRFVAPVMDEGERIGTALIKDGSRPVYLSRGHGCSGREIEEVILGLWSYRIPEPTRRAHILANRVRAGSPSGEL